MIDAVGPIQDVLQNRQRVLRLGTGAGHRFAHGFEAVGCAQKRFAQRTVRHRLVSGQRNQNIFEMMREVCDTAHTDGVGRTLQGVGGAFGSIQITQTTVAASDILHGAGKLAGLDRQFLE